MLFKYESVIAEGEDDIVAGRMYIFLKSLSIRRTSGVEAAVIMDRSWNSD